MNTPHLPRPLKRRDLNAELTQFLDEASRASAPVTASRTTEFRQGEGGVIVRSVTDATGTTVIQQALNAAASARLVSGLSQAAFASLLGVSLRTLQEWEQGRKVPSGAAKTLLAVALQRPDVLRELTA